MQHIIETFLSTREVRMAQEFMILTGLDGMAGGVLFGALLFTCFFLVFLT